MLNSKLRIAFVKFGGLSAGGTERWLQMMAANLLDEGFLVDYYYCDAAPYIGSSFRHADTNSERVRYMQCRGVNLIKFKVGAKDVRKRTHDWVDTNFWDLFDSSRYDFVQTAKAGPAEYPYHLLKLPVIEFVSLDAGVDFSANIIASIHLSSWQRIQWAKRGGCIEKSAVIPIPVEVPVTSEDMRRELGIPREAVVAGFHQRDDDSIMSPIPLQAYAQLEAPHRYFVLMGGGMRYRQQAERLKLANIRFVDHSADPRRISRFLNTLDIYAHGRKDGETFGTVLAEAMIHGKPCLSHRSYWGANAQPETMGPTGLFAENARDYADKLRLLLEDKLLRQDLADKARLFAEARYTGPHCAKALMRIYRDIENTGSYHTPKTEQEIVAAQLHSGWRAKLLYPKYRFQTMRHTASGRLKTFIWSLGLRNSRQWNDWINRLAARKDEIAWVVLGQTLAFGGGFFGVKMLTKRLGPAGYGELALGLSVSGFLFSFIYGPLSSSVIRYYSIYRDKKSLGAYFTVLIRSHALFGSVILFLSLMITAAAKFWFNSWWVPIFAGGVLLGISNGIYTNLLSIYSAMRERKSVAFQQAAEVCARILMALLLIRLLAPIGVWSLLGFFLGNLSVVLLQIWYLRRHANTQAYLSSKDPARAHALRPAYAELYSYAAPMVAFAIFGWITLYADRWVIQGYLGLTEVGIYAALYQIANAPMTIIAGVIGQLIYPIVFERAGTLSHATQFQRSRRVFRMTVAVSGGVFFTIVGVTHCWGNTIVRLLTTPEFASHSRILWVLTLGVALFQMSNVLILKGLYFNMPKIYLWPKICHATAFLGCAYWSVRRYGLPGIAWTWVAASSLYALTVFIANLRCREQKIMSASEITNQVAEPQTFL